MQSSWWFARDDFQVDGCSPLSAPYDDAGLTEQQRTFPSASKLSVTVDHAYMHEDKDGVFRGDNDLVVVTRHKMGSRPEVKRVHYLKAEVEAGTWENFAWHPVIYATDDLQEADEELKLQVGIYDEDGLSDKESETITGALASAAKAAAVAFPAIAPYAGLASGAGTALLKLVDEIDDHDTLLSADERFALNVPPNTGHYLLQPGFLIAFDSKLPVDASSLMLGQDKKVYFRGNAGILAPFKRQSYIVLRIEKRLVAENYRLIDERAATLLHELAAGKGARTSNALHFLRDTFQSYTNFQRIKRYHELKNKDDRNDAEEQLLEELQADEAIAQFLPDLQA